MTGLVLHQTRYDLLSFARNRQARFFTVLLPVIFLVIFVGVFGNNRVGPEHVRSSTYFVPGIAALAIIAASFVNLVISITAQRELGILKRRRATPVPAAALIAGRALTSMVVSLVVMSCVIALGRVAYGVHISASALPAVLLTAVIGSLAFGCLGYAVATAVGSADAAQPAVLAITLPLYFISGVFIPEVRLSGALRQIARVFPVEHLAAALHLAFDPAVHGSAFAWGDLAVIGGWGLAGLAVALTRFTWAPASGRS